MDVNVAAPFVIIYGGVGNTKKFEKCTKNIIDGFVCNQTLKIGKMD